MSSFREAASALAAKIAARQADDDAVRLLESLAQRSTAGTPSTRVTAEPERQLDDDRGGTSTRSAIAAELVIR